MAEEAQTLTNDAASRSGDMKPSIKTRTTQRSLIGELDQKPEVSESEAQFPLYSSFGNEFLTRQAEIESNARTYPRNLPIALRRGKGIYVEDTEGRKYIDCLAGAGALALGHSHPIVVEAIQSALAHEPPLQTLDLPTPLKDRFTRDLFESLPAAFQKNYKIQFCGPSGADAIEAALKLVKTATGRRGLVSFRGAYHGMTHATLGVTGEPTPRRAVGGLGGEVQFLPFPSEYRCPFGVGGEASAVISARYIETLFDDPNSGVLMPAGMIVEVIQGEGGVIPAPDGWLRRVRDITRARGIPLIVDEVQTGLGRTGRLYAFQHAQIEPDVVVLSKAIGGGLPLSVVVYHRDLDQWKSGAHAGTFRGNQLAFATGSATITYVKQNCLDSHAARMGERLTSGLSTIAEQHPCIGDVRGRGLMVGVEIVNGDTPKLPFPDPAPTLARKLQHECLRRGLIVELGGRHGSVVRFLPPLIITQDEIDAVLERFGAAIGAAQRQ